MRLVSDPEPPSSINQQIPSNVDSFVLRLLKRQPEERFGSVPAVLAELSQNRR